METGSVQARGVSEIASMSRVLTPARAVTPPTAASSTAMEQQIKIVSRYIVSPSL